MFDAEDGVGLQGRARLGILHADRADRDYLAVACHEYHDARDLFFPYIGGRQRRQLLGARGGGSVRTPIVMALSRRTRDENRDVRRVGARRLRGTPRTIGILCIRDSLHSRSPLRELEHES